MQVDQVRLNLIVLGNLAGADCYHLIHGVLDQAQVLEVRLCALKFLTYSFICKFHV